MRWEAWVLVALNVASALATIGAVGKPRKATTPAEAVAATVVGAVLTWLVLRLGGVA